MQNLSPRYTSNPQRNDPPELCHPFSHPLFFPSQPTTAFTKFPGIKYEGNIIFHCRGGKVN